MKNNPNGQQNQDKSGKPNQKPAEVSTKNENSSKSQPTKKGKDDEDLRNSVENEEQPNEKRNSGDSRSQLTDSKTGKQYSKKGSM